MVSYLILLPLRKGFARDVHFNAAVCVCLRVNHSDIIRLDVKVDQDLPCLLHYIPRSISKPL